MTKMTAWRCFSVVMALVLLPGVAAIAIPTTSVGAQGGTWDIQTVDNGNVVSTSLALDSQGNPHIAYTTSVFADGFGGHSLHYASWTGTSWVTELVDDVPASVTSLALDSQDRPHICYTTGVVNSLHYAQKVGTAWGTETVDCANTSDCSLALDSQDRPHVCYIVPSDVDPLKYAWWTGAGWQFGVVDPPSVIPTSCSLALDSHDAPHIGYAEIDISSVHYLHPVGGVWVDEVVDGGPGGAVSIALDSQDNPHLSYTTATLLSLHYASRISGAWTTETVDPVNASDCSLAMDSRDRPHISYFVGTNFGTVPTTHGAATPSITLGGMLKYATLTDSAWDIEVVDQETIQLTPFAGVDQGALFGGGKWCSLALDGNDLPHISYGNLIFVTDDSLRYAHIPPVIEPILTTPNVTGVPGTSPTLTRPLAPPQMSLQFLNVSPQNASANQPVTITTNVVNTGDQAGNYNIALKINGQVEESRMISVGPQASQPVKFTVTRDQPGTYTVDIVDQSGSFTILGDSGTGASGQNNIGLIVLALIGVLIVASIVVVLLRRS
jgi:hypothetical protein